MAIDLGDYHALAQRAVARFWEERESAASRQRRRGRRRDTGNRGSVTAGRNMRGFHALVADIVARNGLPASDAKPRRGASTLPGYFRATKDWDVLVAHGGRLVAVLEFKSQVGSVGKNQNNRSEEVIGTALDIATAFRERAFGSSPPPFLGYLLLLEDTPEVHAPVCPISPHFPVFPEFAEASYAQRYDLLCRRLVGEGLYTSAALLLADPQQRAAGAYRELNEETGLHRFVSMLAARVAAAAAMG